MKSRLFGLIAFTTLSTGFAQQPARPAAPEPADDQTRIVLEVTRVNMQFTVADRKGRFVTDLSKDDFELVENKKPQSILEFTAESNLPLRLGILIDTSNSIRDRFKFQQEAAIEFVNSVMRPEIDKAIVVSFDSGAELAADLTSNEEALAKAIRDLRPGGGTSLYDAIYFAARDKLLQDQPRHRFRRAMVILSDGDDNASQHTREQALEMAQKADVVIYAISTNNQRTPGEGDKIMKYLAAETGGIAFFPFKVEDLSQSFENIANELRHQYNLAYRPEPPEDRRPLAPHRNEGQRPQGSRGPAPRRGYYAPKF